MPLPELSHVTVEAPPPSRQRATAPAAAAAAAAPPAATPAHYTPSLLRQTLQVMGAKPRQSDRAARKAFLLLQQRTALPPGEPLSLAARVAAAPGGRAGVALTRPEFERLVMDCLAAEEHPHRHQHMQQQPEAQAARPAGANGSRPSLQQQREQQQQSQRPQQQQQQPKQQQQQADGVAASAAAGSSLPPAPVFSLEDLRVACALREQRTSVAVLLCGTSGTGKSTLAALLAARLGITTVVSTDSIRHMLRSFSSEEEDPLLWASTYQAGARLQQLAAARALPPGYTAAALGGGGAAASPASAAQRYAAAAAAADPRKAAVRGYKAQSARVLEHVDALLAGCEARRQSVVIEGVHLSLSMVVRLMQRHPSAVPFLIHISNEAKHMERFAVRSKVMTLRPDGNRYVQHYGSIRTIQDYLTKSADKHAVPKVDNTNVDRSVATIHASVLGCLRRMARGEAVLSGGGSLSCKLLLEEYLRCQSATWSSSDMLELLRRRSEAGEAPSPSDTESTLAPTVPPTAAASTPRGPLSEAAADDGLHLRAPGAQGRQAGDDADGDARSFYGSDDSQSSSGASSGDSSCSCSGSEAGSDGEDEDSPPGAAGMPAGGSEQQQQQHQQHQRQQPGADGVQPNGSASRLQRQRRHRAWHRLRRGRGGAASAASSGGGAEIPAGPVPLRLRRRSEAGSVLEPDGLYSETEDAEVAGAAQEPISEVEAEPSSP